MVSSDGTWYTPLPNEGTLKPVLYQFPAASIALWVNVKVFGCCTKGDDRHKSMHPFILSSCSYIFLGGGGPASLQLLVPPRPRERVCITQESSCSISPGSSANPWEKLFVPKAYPLCDFTRIQPLISSFGHGILHRGTLLSWEPKAKRKEPSLVCNESGGRMLL